MIMRQRFERASKKYVTYKMERKDGNKKGEWARGQRRKWRKAKASKKLIYLGKCASERVRVSWGDGREEENSLKSYSQVYIILVRRIKSAIIQYNVEENSSCGICNGFWQTRMDIRI